MHLRLRLKPKPYKLLKAFCSFVTNVKSGHSPTVWKKMKRKLLCLPIVMNMILRDVVKKLETLYGVWANCLKVHTLIMCST